MTAPINSHTCLVELREEAAQRHNTFHLNLAVASCRSATPLGAPLVRAAGKKEQKRCRTSRNFQVCAGELAGGKNIVDPYI